MESIVNAFSFGDLCTQIGVQSDGSVQPFCGNPANLSTLLAQAIVVVFIGTALLCFFFIIIGGFKYILSGGNPEKTAGARRTIFNAIIGLAIVYLSIPAMRLIGNVLGFDLTNLKIPYIGF